MRRCGKTNRYRTPTNPTGQTRYPKTVDHSANRSPSTTPIAGATTATADKATEQPIQAPLFHHSSLQGLILGINVEIKVLIGTITKNTA